jgi:predicted P-loop ATPase/GTPase
MKSKRLIPPSAHPIEKCAANLRDVSIHRLYPLAKVWVSWWVSGAVVGAYKGRCISSETGTIQVMDTKKELWDRLENEPERAYRAPVLRIVVQFLPRQQ